MVSPSPQPRSPARRAPLAGLWRIAFALLAVLAVVLAATGAARAGYESPFGAQQPSAGRTDMGVDFCLGPGDPIRAVGDGVVTGIDHDWFRGQPYLWYQLTDGPDAGWIIYVAEQIHDLARVGQILRAGEVVARYAKSGTCIEMGWGSGTPATLAQATGGYTEGQVTRAGVSFARFLISLGVQGSFELTPTIPGAARETRARRRHPQPAGTHTAASAASATRARSA